MKQLLISAAVFGLTAGVAMAQSTIKFASGAPGPAPINGVLQKWSDDVTAASDGALTIEFVPGGVLGKDGQLYDRVQNGVVDLAWDLQAAYPGEFPATTVAELSGAYDNAGPASTALWNLYADGTIAEEYDAVKVLGIFAFATSTVMVSSPVETLADLDGMKLTTGSLMRQKMMEGLGASPVGLPIYEWYQGISRGVIDGVIETTSIVPAFKINEVASHYAELPLGGSTGFVFMNQGTYDNLPDDARAVLDEHTGEVLSRMLGEFWQGAADFGTKLAKDTGGAFVEFSDEDLAKMRETAAPVTDAWIADTPNGQAIYDAFVAAVNDAVGT